MHPTVTKSCRVRRLAHRLILLIRNITLRLNVIDTEILYYQFMMKNMAWYHSLDKAPLSPPDWVFAPVWTILYITIALSLFLFLKNGFSKEKILPLFFFIIQMLLNFAWTPVFFGLQNIKAAYIILAALIVFLVLTIITFYRFSKPAAYLLIPYLLWSVFAAYLNFEILVRNTTVGL